MTDAEKPRARVRKSPTGAAISAHSHTIPLRAKRAEEKGATAGPACLGPPRHDRSVSMWGFGFPKKQITAARTPLWCPCRCGRAVQRTCLWIDTHHREHAHAEKRAPKTKVGNVKPLKKDTLSFVMIRITKEMVISIHDDLIKTEGGALGILCEGTIDYLVGQINAESEGFKKAAWALCVAHFHPFYDGQKRTAFALAAIILRTYGYYFDESDENEIFDALHKIASYECNQSSVEKWLKKISRRL